MATAQIKRVLRIGGSLAVVLPSCWAKERLKAGEEVVVVANGELRIFPVQEKAGQAQYEAKTEAIQ